MKCACFQHCIKYERFCFKKTSLSFWEDKMHTKQNSKQYLNFGKKMAPEYRERIYQLKLIWLRKIFKRGIYVTQLRDTWQCLDAYLGVTAERLIPVASSG